MDIRSRKIITVLATAMVIMAFAVGNAIAQEAASTIGIVDPGSIWQAHPKVQQARQELAALNNQLEARLNLRDVNRFLDEEEVTELEKLKEKSTTTDAEKARIKSLEDTAKQRDVQFRDLIAKKDPTEQEKTSLMELQGRNAEAEKRLSELVREYDKQLKDREAELTQGMTGVDDEILKAVKAVAEAKGLSFVVNQQAVLYGGVDITEAVIAQLTKKQ